MCMERETPEGKLWEKGKKESQVFTPLADNPRQKCSFREPLSLFKASAVRMLSLTISWYLPEVVCVPLVSVMGCEKPISDIRLVNLTR